MIAKQFLFALAVSASFLGSATAKGTGGNTGSNTGSTGSTGSNTGGNNAGSSSSLTLDSNLVQTGSQQTGGNTAGETASATDNANFINFCQGKTLTNGLQVTTGSCNGIVMGDIPAKTSMVSTVILSPQNLQDLTANQSFNVSLQVSNLQAGAFTNATSTYYAAPQALNSAGQIIGHVHVTIQDVGSLNPSTPPDPTTFAFFKGIDDAGNGQGLLQAAVTGGLAAGTYRVCTMSSSSNHQPVLMPVAQRGAQDDCKYFTVGQGSSNNNANTGSSSSSTSTSSSGSNSNTGSNTNTGSNASTGSNTNTGSNTGSNTSTGSKGNTGSNANTGTGTGSGGKGKVVASAVTSASIDCSSIATSAAASATTSTAASTTEVVAAASSSAVAASSSGKSGKNGKSGKSGQSSKHSSNGKRSSGRFVSRKFIA